MWQHELENLKTRGLKSVGLVISDGLTSIENASARVFTGTKHQLCVVHFKRNVLAVFPRTKRAEIGAELKEVFQVETKNTIPIASFKKLISFVKKWETKYPSLKSFKSERNIAYFTYLDFPVEIQRMIYSTNWIERLNRDYKRVLKMREAMPNASSVLALMGSMAMEKEYKTYKYPVSAFRYIEALKRKE